MSYLYGTFQHATEVTDRGYRVDNWMLYDGQCIEVDTTHQAVDQDIEHFRRELARAVGIPSRYIFGDES